jgi:hypothetical protein
MRYVMMLILLVTLAGCSSRPTATPIPTQVPPTATVPAPTATWTATATPQATNTPMPTDTPSPTPSATPTPTATSTLTATIAPVDESVWRVPAVTAAMTMAVIDKMDETAAGLRAGTLISLEAGFRLIGYKAALATAGTMLEDADLPGKEGRYRQDLQDNIVGAWRVIERWQNGEITSATVPAELATVRASSEQTLAELMDELKRLGVSQAQIDEFMAEVNTMLEP